MKLEAVQKKIVRSKPVDYCLIKGKASTGKTTAAVHRILFLKNQYCLYNNDRILMVTFNHDENSYIKDKYNQVEEENKLAYMTLFSDCRERVNIHTIQELIYNYFKDYQNENECNLELIDKLEEKIKFLKQCAYILKDNFKCERFLKDEYLEFYLEEIQWIKSKRINTLEQYQNIDRVGRKCEKGKGPQRILKNSIHREVIYNLMNLYKSKLEENNYIDFQDMTEVALKQVKKCNSKKYTHILVDDAENISPLYFEFIQSMVNVKPYSSTMFILNNEIDKKVSTWLFKQCKKESERGKCRSYNLKKSNNLIENNIIEVEKEKLPKNLYIEEFEYVDLKHHRQFIFSRDMGNGVDVFLSGENQNVEFSREELKEIPVFSNIAAGEPIYMQPEMEDVFYIPQYWIKGSQECFILKVKGDSMIGANINDGDLVVIKRQPMAQNRDIVAVQIEGNATLKRLFMSKEGIYLMPENHNYEPIEVKDEGASILGVAEGIIKNKNN